MRSLQPTISHGLVLCGIVIIACGGASDEQAGKNTTQVEQPYAHTPTNPGTGIAALAGTWNGVAEVKGYGMAAGVLTLDAQGKGHYLVTLAGISKNGFVQISFFDGRWLTGRAAGYEERVPASLVRDTLTVELPFVGRVSIEREKPRR